VADAAASLSLRRAGTARELGGAVSTVLAELGFPTDAFEVALGRRPAARDDPAVEVDGDAVAFDGSGIDTVVFQFRPNQGEPARPLARIASGGELSRVALAIKQVLADVDATPTLVFDEIDTGIGGRSADPVGRSLWTLAREHQVLCVTHLPQIAAYADAHYRIAKRERDGRTVTDISRLDRAERERELAQMIGGPEGGEAATLSARELLDRAEAWRGGRLADALV
jgi:DNA repair protein RecN (Recombination protein N)